MDALAAAIICCGKGSPVGHSPDSKVVFEFSHFLFPDVLFTLLDNDALVAGIDTATVESVNRFTI